MHFDDVTENTCSGLISLDIEGDAVKNVRFWSGCGSNLEAA